MKSIKIALAAGVALMGAGTAEAKKNWSVWVQCDGYAKPESAGAKAAKGLLALSTLGLFGIPESHNPEGRAKGAAGVDACKAALADPAAAEGPWLRRVTLNQALAVHHIEAGDAAAALAAVDAAKAAAGDNAANPFFARSTGVSLSFLRGVALLRLGRNEEAVAEAKQAAAARPYSARTQMLALGLMGLDPETQPEEMALAERLAALDPSAADVAATLYLRGGRYKDAWALLEKSYAANREARGKQTSFAALTDRGLSEALITSFAAARAGEDTAAMRILDEQKAEMTSLAGQLTKMKLSLGEGGESLESQLAKPIELWRPVVEAAGLMAKGEAAAAQEKLLSKEEWGASTLLVDLAADIRAKLPPEQRKGLVAIDPAELRAKIDGGREARLERVAGANLFALLPEPEDEKRLNSYSKQAGWGLKPTGFKHKKLDNGLTRIEFVGSSSSPLAVEEMTLLRAADLAKAGGHAGFVIERRADYSRMRQMTMNGVPVGQQTLAGYMTQMDVRFVPALDERGAQDAAALVAALKPIYVRPKEAPRR